MSLSRLHHLSFFRPAGDRLRRFPQASRTTSRFCSGESHVHHHAFDARPSSTASAHHPSSKGTPTTSFSTSSRVQQQQQHDSAWAAGPPGQTEVGKEGPAGGGESDGESESRNGPVAHVSQRLQAIMKHNRHFVDNKLYLQPQTSVPTTSASRCIVVTCMDARLTHLLEDATGLRPGQAKKIKTAGAIVSHPFGGIMRSVIVALYELNADEVFVIGHHDCGMNNINTQATLQKVIANGNIPAETISTLQYAGIDLHKWLHGFDSVQDSVRSGVETITHHPLVPRDVPVHGLIIDPHTGKLDLVIDGSDTMKARAVKPGIGKVRADAAEALGH